MKTSSLQSPNAAPQFPNRSGLLSERLSPQLPTEGSWVQLLHPPSPFSHSEALLLCAEGDDQWRAWIPDYGEAVLRANEFFVGG